MSAQDCSFNVGFTTKTATCHNNGKIAYALVDRYGKALPEVPSNLSAIRIYFKKNENDAANYKSTYYTGGWDTLTINPGTWIVGVEAICTQGPGVFSEKRIEKTLTVPSSYTTPTATVINNSAFGLNEYGTRPTLDCANTGRVQLKIVIRMPIITQVQLFGHTQTWPQICLSIPIRSII